ncbi:MAG TPA: thioredoxin-dependent thiol peroxidase [Anaerolineaceae bacterium]|nr:thioredoxin-dependent thiol peroxidase [Anaerolineaceae bacterium]
MIMELNKTAPNFELNDQSGQPHKLSDYIGKRVVLYFYPKDDTPGCTAEACSFRDNYSVFKQNDIVILGVSADSEKSHAKFQEKYELPFTLLSDTDHQVSEAYGVWGLKKYMGREYYGINRTTFLIDEEGKLVKIYEKVKPAEHAQEIMQDFI